MDDAKHQLADKLKSSNNILVTVSRDPSVDQLASCIGLTLFLNKQGKHAAAVFSGKVPSTLEFLQPEDTLEKNTDSLRDFIIALDKSKADKLRYKVENDVVRIFITPYKTSINEADLEFTQGDFNVDVVVALGVDLQEDLDEAITAHGRILHDATVTSVNVSPDGGLGTINWHDPQASSLSELVTDLVQLMNSNLLDSQIATALLTGIVSETDRFRNDKTSSLTMSASAVLMAAGANQQLVASKLEEAPELAGSLEGAAADGKSDDTLPPYNAPSSSDSSDAHDDGMIEIDHNDQGDQAADTGSADQAEDSSSSDALPSSDSGDEATPQLPKQPSESPAPAVPDPVPDLDPVAPDPVMPDPPVVPPAPPTPDPVIPGLTPPPPAWVPPSPSLPPSEPLEPPSPPSEPPVPPAFDSPSAATPANLDAARDEVGLALSGSSNVTDMSSAPIEALGAQPLGNDLHPNDSLTVPEPPAPTADPAPSVDANAPPPVPPPIPFQFGNSAQPR